MNALKSFFFMVMMFVGVLVLSVSAASAIGMLIGIAINAARIVMR